jgi:hypothetical protein
MRDRRSADWIFSLFVSSLSRRLYLRAGFVVAPAVKLRTCLIQAERWPVVATLRRPCAAPVPP